MLIAMLPLGINITAQTENVRYQILRANGDKATLDEITSAMLSTEVIFIGESHNDRVAHELELELLRLVVSSKAQINNLAKSRPIALSLEMFERDVQVVLDEYLAGLITENHFRLGSRPWENYNTDYRPLVEFARENRLPVIAANAPRRYVNSVNRFGRTALERLSPTARGWIAPLPFSAASPAYAAKFARLMTGMPSAQRQPLSTPQSGAPVHSSSLLDAQSLWDATMAYSIAEHLKRTPEALVLQLNGRFHSEERLGAPEHLLRYRPATRFIVITIIPRKEATSSAPQQTSNLGDFIILTEETS